jgi:cobalt-zinc-cadmium efflux system outer membrane protein
MLSVLLIALTVAASDPPQATVPPAAAAVTLEQAVSTVLARSPGLKAAQARTDAAKEAARHAGALPNPTVEVRSENWTFNSWAWTPKPDPAAPPGLDFFTVLTQPVEIGGQRGKRAAIGAADRDEAEAALAATQRLLILDIIRVYVDALRSREWLRALDSNREGLDTLLRAMTSRVREGYTAEADLAKFQAESARVDTQRLRARLDLGRSLSLLTSLMQDPVPIGADQLVEPVMRLAPPGDPVQLAAQAADRSPEVRAARARAARARDTVDLERARRVPDLHVAGGYKRTAGTDTAIVGVLMAIPLFDRNTRAIATASGDRLAADFELAAIEARARADAQVVFDAARVLGERATHVDADLLKPADTVRTAARSAFREGATDILMLVDAERVYVDARREAVQLKLDAIAAALEARLLLGEEIVR